MLLLAGVLAACGDPPTFKIEYALTQGPAQACVAASGAMAKSCADVAMPCDAVLSVRIISPSDPSTPFVSQCARVVADRPKDLCSIAGIDLPAPMDKIPAETLEVQVAVYADADLPHDDANQPMCPTDLQFSADGLPAESSPSPAVGGRAFYHPGDTTTVVTLGCTDEAAIQDPKCINQNMIAVTATVTDFDTDVPVPASLAAQLNVLVGEPQPVTIGATTEYELPPTQTRALDLVSGPTPSWAAAVDLKLVATACLEVLEDIPQATPTVTCKLLSTLGGGSMLDITGVRLSTATLDQILMALPTHTTQFPPQGLVIGIVLDQLGNPVQNVVVTADNTTTSVQTLSENRQQIVAGATSSNGIFVSANAPYGTTFSVGSRGSAFGGLVAGKVTIVILQVTPTP